MNLTYICYFDWTELDPVLNAEYKCNQLLKHKLKWAKYLEIQYLLDR